MLARGRGVILFTGASASMKGFAQSAPFAMGNAGVNPLRFLGLNMIAALIWALIYGGSGYVFGHAIGRAIGDVHHYGLDVAPDLQFYAPHGQWTDSYMQLVVRTRNDPRSVLSPVREAVRAIDPDQAVAPAAEELEVAGRAVPDCFP